MSHEIEADVQEVLSRLPWLQNMAEEPFKARRLRGLTNRVFQVEAPGMDAVIVRIPGKGTEAYIDRTAEIANVQAAARAGVAPPVLYADAATGIMVSRYVSNCLTMTAKNFKTVAGSAGRAGAALRQLHQSGEIFSGRFELFAMIEQYLSLLEEKQAVLPDGYHEVVAAARPVREVLTAQPAALAPCHCDPLAENFLDDGTKIWIVDYEYSGMSDPMWDLGDLSVEAEFTEGHEQEMLASYFGRAPNAAEKGRVVIYKAMCDLLWTLWGLIQHADGNPADDFWAYANRRFARCKALMRQEAFSRHIDAVWSG